VQEDTEHTWEGYSSNLGEEEILRDLKEGGQTSHTGFDSIEEVDSVMRRRKTTQKL
jgi:hypothetical protein